MDTAASVLPTNGPGKAKSWEFKLTALLQKQPVPMVQKVHEDTFVARDSDFPTRHDCCEVWLTKVGGTNGRC